MSCLRWHMTFILLLASKGKCPNAQSLPIGRYFLLTKCLKISYLLVIILRKIKLTSWALSFLSRTSISLTYLQIPHCNFTTTFHQILATPHEPRVQPHTVLRVDVMCNKKCAQHSKMNTCGQSIKSNSLSCTPQPQENIDCGSSLITEDSTTLWILLICWAANDPLFYSGLCDKV